MSILNDLLLKWQLMDKPLLDELEEGLRTFAGDLINIVDDFVTPILDPNSEYYEDEDVEPEYGDIIGVDRLFYKHYGVYMGDEQVIHYARFEDLPGRSVIHQTELDVFLKGADTFFICKFPDTYGEPDEIDVSAATAGSLYAGQWINLFNFIKNQNYRLYSPEDTVGRALDRLAEEKYNLIFNNCEHFVMWCKTGISESHQVNRLLSTIPLLKVIR